LAHEDIVFITPDSGAASASPSIASATAAAGSGFSQRTRRVCAGSGNSKTPLAGGREKGRIKKGRGIKMAGNPMPTSIPPLIVLAGKCADGEHDHAVVIGILQYSDGLPKKVGPLVMRVFRVFGSVDC
jgi:hypothetical protein